MGASANSIRAGGAFVELYAEDSALQRGLAAAQKRLRAFANSVQAVGRSMMTGGLAGGFAAGISASTFAEFEQAMLATRGISQSTAEEFAMLSEEAQRLGRETSFTAVEIANAMTELARGGANATEIIGSMQNVLNLSRGTMTDLSRATQITVSTMRQFKIGADEASRVTDALVIGANSSLQTVEQLGEALAYAGVEMRSAGTSLEGTIAFLAVMADNGIQASSAGTQLRRVARELGEEAKRNRLESLFPGLDITDEKNNFAGINVLMEQYVKNIERLGTADQQSLGEEIFGRGQVAAKIIGENSERIKELIKTMTEFRGENNRLSDEMDSGLTGAFDRVKSAFEVLQIAFGESFRNELMAYLTQVQHALASLTEWIMANQAAAAAAAKFVAGMALAGAGLLAFAGSLKLVAGGMAVFATTAAVVGRVSEAFHSLGQAVIKAFLPAMKRSMSILRLVQGGIVTMNNAAAAARYVFVGMGADIKAALPKSAPNQMIAFAAGIKYVGEMAKQTAASMMRLYSSSVTIKQEMAILTANMRAFAQSLIKADRAAVKFFIALRNGAKLATTAIMTLATTLTGLLASMVVLAIADQIIKAVVATYRWVRGVEDLQERFEQLDSKKTLQNRFELVDAERSFKNLIGAVRLTEEQQDRLAKSIKMLETEYGSLGAEFDETTGRVSNVGEVIARLAAAKQQSRSINSLKTEFQGLRTEMDQLLDGRRVDQLATAELDKLNELSARYDEIGMQIEDYEKAIESAAEVAREAARLEAEARQEQADAEKAKNDGRTDTLADLTARADRLEELKKQEMEAAETLAELRIKRAYEGHEEELALLNLRRQAAIDAAKELGEEIPSILGALDIEEGILRDTMARESEKEQIDFEEELSSLRAQLRLEDHALEMELLEIEQQAALKRAEIEGESVEQLEQLFALRKAIAELEESRRLDDIRTKALEKQQEAAEKLAETLRPESLGGTLGTSLAPLILGEGGVQQKQLEALKALLEAEKETKDAIEDLGQVGAGAGVPGI